MTKRVIEAAIARNDRPFVWDSALKGFGLKVSKRGGVYILQYRLAGSRTTKRYTIGRHDAPWTPDDARARARAVLQQVQAGIDPLANERARAEIAAREAQALIEMNFSSCFESYLDQRVDGQRRAKEVVSIFARDLKPQLGSKAITQISRSDIIRLLDKVSRRNKSASNKAHKVLSTFFAWAVARDRIAQSPLVGLPRPHPDCGLPRDHIIADSELRTIWTSAARLNAPFGRLFQMLLVTGQRLREVAGMDWAEVDLLARTWTIPKSRTKNGRTHIVPLNLLALRILGHMRSDDDRQGLIFTTNGRTPVSGFSKAKSQIDELCLEICAGENATFNHWRLHDLRRTFATGCERMGVAIAVTEALLNHAGGTKGGIIGVYQRHSYAAEKRAAMDRWGQHLTRFAID